MLVKNKLDAPWRITFDTNPDQCNIQCIMCEEHSKYNLKQNKMNRVMDFKIIEDTIKNTVNNGLKEIIPSTMGEPLLYKNFINLLNLIKGYNLNINLTTNGTFPILGAEEWGKLILPVASDVKISINGASKKINESIMEGNDFEKQIENLQKFIQIRDDILKERKNNPTVTLQVTFMESNIEEMPDLLKLAIDMKVDRFKGHHVWIVHPQLEKESLRHNKSTIKRWNKIVEKLHITVEKERLKKGNKIKLDNIYQISYNGKKEIIPDNHFCPFLGREAWIAWDGTFNVCCAPDNLRKTFGNFGNVKDTNFLELWNSKNYKQLVQNWGIYDVCKMCNMRRPLDTIMGCKND